MNVTLNWIIIVILVLLVITSAVTIPLVIGDKTR